MLTGPEAGITRDSIRVEWQWRGRPIRLVDTAGMRRRSRIDAKLEAASVADTLDTIRLADVVVVVLDAADMAEKQDLTIAGRVIEEGRALVIAVNKTDLLADDQSASTKAWRKLRDRLEASFAQVKDVPIVGFSALNGPRHRPADAGGVRRPTTSGTSACRRPSSIAGCARWRPCIRRRSPRAGASGCAS